MIGDRVAKSASRMAVVQLAAKGLDFFGVMIVARFLTPEDFGLVAIATTVLLIANALTELPVADVLVQKDGFERPLVDTAFTLGLIRGILICMSLLAAAPLVAYLFEDRRLYYIIGVISIGPLIQGITSPMVVTRLRDLDYRPVAWSQFSGKLAAFIILALIAFITQSYWALVASLVVNPAVTSLATYYFAPYRPKLRLAQSKEIFSFAGWVAFSRMIFTINQQFDRFFVGAILGKDSLGRYAMASDLSSMVTYMMASPIMQPLFSGLSRLNSDPDRQKHAFLKGQRIMVTIITPLGFGFAAISFSLIPLVLGEAWRDIAYLIIWLAPVISLQMLVVPVQSLAMAMAQPKQLVLREVVSLLLRLPATLFAALHFGLVGAVITRSIAALILILYNLSIARKLINVSVAQQLLGVARPVLSALFMAFALIVIQGVWPEPISGPLSALRISLLIVFGAGIYIFALLSLWVFAGCPDGAEHWLLTKVSSSRTMS